MTPLYNTSAGTNTPNFNNILLKNLVFLNDAGSAGTLQFTGTNTAVGGQPLVYPLQVTLSNVTFPDALTLSRFVTTGSAGTEQYAQLTYGPGDVSSNFITDWATFVATTADHDTATNNITASALTPPACNFTYLAPELTGPAGQPQTITYGQPATAAVILTPAVGGAAYPTGTVTLTDSLTGNLTQATLPGNTDTLFIPLNGLGLGTHTFTATYPGDTNYVALSGQAAYSTAGPYVITVNPAPQVALLTTSTIAPAPAGSYQATVTVTNNGAPTVTNLALTKATLGTAAGTITTPTIPVSPSAPPPRSQSTSPHPQAPLEPPSQPATPARTPVVPSAAAYGPLCCLKAHNHRRASAPPSHKARPPASSRRPHIYRRGGGPPMPPSIPIASSTCTYFACCSVVSVA